MENTYWTKSIITTLGCHIGDDYCLKQGVRVAELRHETWPSVLAFTVHAGAQSCVLSSASTAIGHGWVHTSHPPRPHTCMLPLRILSRKLRVFAAALYGWNVHHGIIVVCMVLVFCKSMHLFLRKHARKELSHLMTNDLDLWPCELNLALPVALQVGNPS